MNNTLPIDPVALTADLVRCRSVTPQEGGALELLESVLIPAGFICHRIDRNGVPNLFAKFEGPKDAPVFGFNGHTDVVPTGNVSDWSYDPFGGEIADGYVWGRGSTDMKSGVAAFVAASVDFVRQNPSAGSVILTITGDEEGIAKDGTLAILDWMRSKGESMDACLVGEPTCPNKIGDMIKIGRRGSLTAKFCAVGKQGHSAYPERAINPVEAIANLVVEINQNRVDPSTKNFQPTSSVVTSVDTGNTASNVIPAYCRATVNVRFNDLSSSDDIFAWLRKKANGIEKKFGITIDMQGQCMGDCFLTEPGEFSDLVSNAVFEVCGRKPELSTSGGTSDARYIKDMCPVVEFGLAGQTMHQIDERVSIKEINLLKSVYLNILNGYFN